MNVVAVVGRLSSEPTIRELPTGSVLVNYEVTTPVEDGAVSVPLVWFDPPKPVALAKGDEVAAVGTVRRRFFRVGGVTQSRTEVVVSHLGRRDDKRAAAAQRKWLSAAIGAELLEALRSS
jgi:single-strand DNA-binding protein